jgi:hypothetical protein
LPITQRAQKHFPRLLRENLIALEKQNLVCKTPKGWFYSGIVRPVDIVNLNSISDKIVTTICNGEVLETIDQAKAYGEAHEGAVLHHQGETHIVKEVNLKGLTAKVRARFQGDPPDKSGSKRTIIYLRSSLNPEGDTISALPLGSFSTFTSNIMERPLWQMRSIFC